MTENRTGPASTDAFAIERRRVRDAQAGNEDAWRLLFDDYYPRVYQFIRRRVATAELAEDLAADAFVDAFRGLPKFQWRGAPFGAWLFKVARNRVASHYRSPRPAADDTSDEQALRLASPVDETLKLDVVDALERLPGDYREAIELRYMLGLSGAEAAAAMGRSDGAFRMLLHRATEAFKKEYGGGLPD